MRFTTLSRAFILAITLLLNTSCHKPPSPLKEKKQCIRVNIHTEPPTLDLRKASDTSSISVIGMCFEGLMKRNLEGEIVPAAAESFDVSQEGTLYTFHLRQDIKWSDGTPLTAFDFEATWKTLLSPEFPCGFASDLYLLKGAKEAKTGQITSEKIGVKALRDDLLQIEIEHPAPYFLNLLASHAFFAAPHHIASRFPHWAEEASPLFVGNGPYQLIKWKHHNEIVLRKNPYYWNAEKVILTELRLHILENEITELNMFETGDLDWAGHPLSTLPPDSLDALKKRHDIHTSPISGVYYYIFNTQSPPFDNVNFRKAFTLAIHRQEIIDHILQCEQSPALGFIPPTIWDPSVYFKDQDLVEARRLFQKGLEETGYTKETFPQICLSYNTSSAHHRIAQAIQEQWHSAFGIQVRLINKEWKVFLDEVNSGQFQIARMGGIASYRDPMTFLDAYRYADSAPNHSKWSHPEFTKLLEKAESTKDSLQRKIFLKEAERIFMEEMPIAPIYYYTGSYIKQNYVRNVLLSDLCEIDFKFAFLEMH